MPLGGRLFGDPFACPFFGGALRPLAREGIGCSGVAEHFAGRLQECAQGRRVPPLRVPGHPGDHREWFLLQPGRSWAHRRT